MNERLKPQFFSPEEIAELFRTEPEQVYVWMAEDQVPWVELQGQAGEYRLPLHGVQFSLDSATDMNTGEPFMKPVHDMLKQLGELGLQED